MQRMAYTWTSPRARGRRRRPIHPVPIVVCASHDRSRWMAAMLRAVALRDHLLRRIAAGLAFDAWNVDMPDINCDQQGRGRTMNQGGLLDQPDPQRAAPLPHRRSASPGHRADVLRLSRLHRRPRPHPRGAAGAAPGRSPQPPPGADGQRAARVPRGDQTEPEPGVRQLVDDGLVENSRRPRGPPPPQFAPEAGQAFEQELSAAQRRRMRAAADRGAGGGARLSQGARARMPSIPELRERYRLLREQPPAHVLVVDDDARLPLRSCRSSSPATASS